MLRFFTLSINVVLYTNLENNTNDFIINTQDFKAIWMSCHLLIKG